MSSCCTCVGPASNHDDYFGLNVDPRIAAYRCFGRKKTYPTLKKGWFAGHFVRRRFDIRPIPSATCTVQTRKQVPRGAFFFMCQRGLQAPSALRRQTRRARSVSERPPSLSTRPSLPARRIQNSNRFQRTDGIGLRPCFAGSGLSQSRWRRDTRGVLVGMSWEFCAKSLMTNAVSALSLA